ncbi:hypothetical protein NUW54_g49 [Trametes sanguinea]|uniref:Uncharacterized protein n=3 Tax=Trametes sanguinea TaxID=158606 RepID=A0ACC1Q8L5_9APHY|nr:hypothetical protein NUW54_g3160 [Trametes sanguinea]KAJ3017155.1 hypothetical protein NUW54_g653 [Trametes sanguinea]KAJ3019583.1 hypothetical protein NUW54_g49 [Trametes sanguinea]
MTTVLNFGHEWAQSSEKRMNGNGDGTQVFGDEDETRTEMGTEAEGRNREDGLVSQSYVQTYGTEIEQGLEMQKSKNAELEVRSWQVQTTGKQSPGVLELNNFGLELTGLMVEKAELTLKNAKLSP